MPAGDERPLLDGRYELGRVLGRGGMSTVHVARDHRTGRDVAIKLFQPAPDLDDAEQRYRREVTLLAGLHDPGLLTVFDADLHDHFDPAGHTTPPYLVTELVDGPTLAQRIKQAPLAEGQALRLGAAIARTLTYVHQLGIVHRDIKPANILLPATAEDPFDAPKLVDFGIAIAAQDTRLTATNLTIGTANYLSPEQLHGQRVVTSAADIYSLGLVLIEALSGQPAYPGSGLDAAMARLDHQPEIPVAASPGVRAVLAEMTAADPDDRPEAAHVCDELARLTPIDSLTTQLVPLGAAGAGGAGGAAGAAGAAAPVPPDAPPTIAELPRSRRTRDGRPGRGVALAAALIAAALAGVIVIASLNGQTRGPVHTPAAPPDSHPSRTVHNQPAATRSPAPAGAAQPTAGPGSSTSVAPTRSRPPHNPPSRPASHPGNSTATSPTAPGPSTPSSGSSAPSPPPSSPTTSPSSPATSPSTSPPTGPSPGLPATM
jgi:serine/threonine protein kinase